MPTPLQRAILTRRRTASLWRDLVFYAPLNEESGGAPDVINGLSLADSGGVTSNPGQIGRARQFTAASSQTLSIADNAALSITGDMTMTVWVYMDSKPAGNMAVACKADLNAAGTIEYALWYPGSGTDRFRFTVSDGTTFHTATSTASAPSTATWYYLVGRHRNGVDCGISVNNGAFDNTAHTTGIQDSTRAFRIGSDDSVARYWDGRINHLKIWRRLLTTDELLQDYANGFAGVPLR